MFACLRVKLCFASSPFCLAFKCWSKHLPLLRSGRLGKSGQRFIKIILLSYFSWDPWNLIMHLLKVEFMLLWDTVFTIKLVLTIKNKIYRVCPWYTGPNKVLQIFQWCTHCHCNWVHPSVCITYCCSSSPLSLHLFQY